MYHDFYHVPCIKWLSQPLSINCHVNVFSSMNLSLSFASLLMPLPEQTSPSELISVQRRWLTDCSYSLNRTNQFTNEHERHSLQREWKCEMLGAFTRSVTLLKNGGRLLWIYHLFSDLEEILKYRYVSSYSLKILRYIRFRPYRPALLWRQ